MKKMKIEDANFQTFIFIIITILITSSLSSLKAPSHTILSVIFLCVCVCVHSGVMWSSISALLECLLSKQITCWELTIV